MNRHLLQVIRKIVNIIVHTVPENETSTKTNMKIQTNQPKEPDTQFESIKPGECFKLDDMFCIKNTDDNAVSLEDGEIPDIDHDQSVIPLPNAIFCPYGLPTAEDETCPEGKDGVGIVFSTKDFALIAKSLEWARTALDLPARGNTQYAKAYKAFLRAIDLFESSKDENV